MITTRPRHVAEYIKRHRRRLTALTVTLLVGGFLGWLWCYLRPDTWHYYTDETSFMQRAKDVQPRFVLWEDACLSPGVINEPDAACEPTISPDGMTLVFSRGGTTNANLFASRWKDGAWSPGKPLRALNSQFNEIEPAFSRDGSYLFFSTDRPGGPGGYDIWVSRWDGAVFAWPVPLTGMINSPFDERGPEPNAADDRLYFSSNRPRGVLSEAEEAMSGKQKRKHFAFVDHDIFMANVIPVGVTNREVERAQSMLYYLRESALSDPAVMQKLGGSDATEKAIDSALVWLGVNQNTNGSWSVAGRGGKTSHDVAATSFALLSYFGRGQRHDRPGKYRNTVSLGLDWLLKQQDPMTGDMRGRTSGRRGDMYDHGIASLCLAEAYGLSKDQELYGAAQSAIDFIVDSQNPDDGGWRYKPREPGDTSVSGWQIMALKSGEYSGLHVPDSTYEGVRRWLKQTGGGKHGGQYGYQRPEANRPAMMATGFFCSQLMGLSPNTRRAFESARHVEGSKLKIGDIYFAYYGTLSAYQNQGPLWRSWRDALQKKFLGAQAKDGSWNSADGHAARMGPVIVTSLVSLSLQAHYRYTPLYGLGYEPDRDAATFSTATLDDLPPAPLYRRAKRLRALSSPRHDRDVAITAHGDFLYFASNRKGGNGGFDLYRSRISGLAPEPPTRLGPEINSSANETDPALRMAGFNLIFASDRTDTDAGKSRLYSAMTRQVFRRHDYATRPAMAWMIALFPHRLTGLLIALLTFLFLVVHGFRSSRRRKARPGPLERTRIRRCLLAWRQWIPPSLLFLVMLGLMLSICLTLKNTVWCYYTDDVALRRDATDADVRLILWEDPYRTSADFNQPTNALALAFSEDGDRLTLASTDPKGTNAASVISTWDGRRWHARETPATEPEPHAVDRAQRRNGDFLYFDAEDDASLGGKDIYRRRILDGSPSSPENLGSEINSPSNDVNPALRMEGFDMLFMSDRHPETAGKYLLFSSTTREVVGRLDLARWYSFTAMLKRMRWWILLGVAALALLIYLLRHWKDLTNLFHKCVMASVMVHLAILLCMAFWIVSAEFLESMDPETMEVAIDVDALAKEKLALDMAEQVTELPAMPETVVIQQAQERVPMPRFTPPAVPTRQPIVTQTTDNSFVTKVTPSKAQEASAEVATVVTVDALPELEIPDMDIVMEEREAIPEVPDTETAKKVFEPTIVQKEITVEHREVSPDVTRTTVRETAVATVSPDVVARENAGTTEVDDTGGDLVVATAGMESEGALPDLAGAGEVASLLIQSPGNSSDLAVDAPGELDVPSSFGDTISPELLRNPGKLSSDTIEGLGGSADTQGSIARALDWFSRNQEGDGRWDIKKHGGEEPHDIAATSLILLCYYGWGAKHNEAGPYRDQVKRAIDWLIQRGTDDNGTISGDYFRHSGHNGMYDQGMAAIALCEAYGVTKDERLREPAQKAIDFIVKAQDSKSGGWRYKPRSGGDTSVFGWQYMALRSAEMAGLELPAGLFDTADRWLDRVAGGKAKGLYGYTSGGRNQSAMIATGMFCRQLAKVPPSDQRMREGAVYMRMHPLNAKNMDFYYLYYGTLCLYQHQGGIWEGWNQRMKEALVATQHKSGGNDGTWDPRGGHGNRMGRAVATALATLSLEVYYRILPIYGFRDKTEE